MPEPDTLLALAALVAAVGTFCKGAATLARALRPAPRKEQVRTLRQGRHDALTIPK